MGTKTTPLPRPQAAGSSPISRRGTAMVQTAVFGALVGVGTMALTVDTGMMFNARGELQAAADAAALAGCRALSDVENGLTNAPSRAVEIASKNKVRDLPAYMDASDVVFGKAVPNGNKFDFTPNQQPFNALQARVRRDGADPNRPKVPLMFGRALFNGGASTTAEATAMLVPRDIAVVVDLSGSMNNDSEARHYRNYTTDTGSTHSGVTVNLGDVWIGVPCQKGNNGVGNGIDPQPPGNPTNYNDQPGTGPGSPNSQGGNPNPGADPTHGPGGCTGPRWGWLTGFGISIM